MFWTPPLDREISPAHFPAQNGSYDAFMHQMRIPGEDYNCCTGTPPKVLDRNLVSAPLLSTFSLEIVKGTRVTNTMPMVSVVVLAHTFTAGATVVVSVLLPATNLGFRFVRATSFFFLPSSPFFPLATAPTPRQHRYRRLTSLAFARCLPLPPSHAAAWLTQNDALGSL